MSHVFKKILKVFYDKYMDDCYTILLYTHLKYLIIMTEKIF